MKPIRSRSTRYPALSELTIERREAIRLLGRGAVTLGGATLLSCLPTGGEVPSPVEMCPGDPDDMGGSVRVPCEGFAIFLAAGFKITYYFIVRTDDYEVKSRLVEDQADWLGRFNEAIDLNNQTCYTHMDEKHESVRESILSYLGLNRSGVDLEVQIILEKCEVF